MIKTKIFKIKNLKFKFKEMIHYLIKVSKVLFNKIKLLIYKI